MLNFVDKFFRLEKQLPLAKGEMVWRVN